MLKFLFKKQSPGCSLNDNNINFIHLGLIIVFIKLFFYFLDPTPQFFLGDSESYIATAINGWIPPNRSFVYGFLIRYLTFVSHSLTSLVLAQVVATTLSCLLLAYVLRVLKFPKWSIFSSAIICAVDPLLLLYERYVMAESFGFLGLTLFVACWFKFLDKPVWPYIVLANLAGICAVALRLSYLPVIQFGVIVCPLLYFLKDDIKKELPLRIRIRKTVALLLVSLCCYFALHSGYKHFNGYLSESKPAYNYESGFFLLASWSPLIQADDFDDKAMASVLLPGTYRDYFLRESNRWSDDGIVSRLKKIQSNEEQAEATARAIARNIFCRDPLGVARLGFMTYSQLWNKDTALWAMRYDRGERKLSPDFLKLLSEKYHIDASGIPFISTITNQYFFLSIWWYRILLVSPLFLLIGFILGEKEERLFLILLMAVSSSLLLISIMLSTMPVMRYLHPLGWIFILGSAITIRRLAKIILAG